MKTLFVAEIFVEHLKIKFRFILATHTCKIIFVVAIVVFFRRSHALRNKHIIRK